jgi:hypothetical protein
MLNVNLIWATKLLEYIVNVDYCIFCRFWKIHMHISQELTIELIDHMNLTNDILFWKLVLVYFLPYINWEIITLYYWASLSMTSNAYFIQYVN